MRHCSRVLLYSPCALSLRCFSLLCCFFAFHFQPLLTWGLAGRYDLARALERWGGHNDVAQMLGLGVRQKRPKGLTLAGKRRGTKAWKNPEGEADRGGAVAAKASAPGGEAKEDEGGPSDGAKERGKVGGAANMPVKASLPRTTKKWFTLSLSLEAPGPEAEFNKVPLPEEAR